MRPPGYEPGELPTAPTRDINHAIVIKILCYPWIASAKVVLFFETTKFYLSQQAYLNLINI